MELLKGLAIVGGILLIPFILVFIVNALTKKGGEKFMAGHRNAVKLYGAKLGYGQSWMMELHKSYKGKYAYFNDKKGYGIVLLPGILYNIKIMLQETSGNYKKVTSVNYDNFVPAGGKTYVVSYDEAKKVFSLEEGLPD